jgi:hypothetical protein
LNIEPDKFSAEQMRASGFSGACKHLGKADQARALFRKQKSSVRFSKARAEGLHAVFGESLGGKIRSGKIRKRASGCVCIEKDMNGEGGNDFCIRRISEAQR